MRDLIAARERAKFNEKVLYILRDDANQDTYECFLHSNRFNYSLIFISNIYNRVFFLERNFCISRLSRIIY